MSEINEDDDDEQMPSVASPPPIINLKPSAPGQAAPQNFKSILKTSSFNKQALVGKFITANQI